MAAPGPDPVPPHPPPGAVQGAAARLLGASCEVEKQGKKATVHSFFKSLPRTAQREQEGRRKGCRDQEGACFIVFY